MSDLRSASFRGVRFDVDARTVTVGRRVVLHEYPQRDAPYAEDLGRKARRYKVDAFIIGSDSAIRRDLLLAALEKPGSGQLVHPDFGTLMVVVPDDAEITQSREEIGKVAFSLTFIEAGEALFPRASQDTGAVLSASADAAVLAEIDQFVSAFSVTESSAVQAAAKKSLLTTLKNLSASISSLASLSPDNLLALLPDSAKLALALANTVISGVMEVQLAGAIAADKWKRFSASDLLGLERLQILKQESGSAAGTLGARQIANSRALDDLMQGISAVVLMQGYAQLEMRSVDDAEDARERITQALDRVLYERIDGIDDLLAQRTAAVRHINATSVGLPRLAKVRLKQSLPALAVAYEQHGSIDNLNDLLARNKITHPGFVPAGRDLDILLV